MILSPGARKLLLTAHVASSVGWLGAVAAFFALAAVGLWGESLPEVKAAYGAMPLVGWKVILPLCVAALCTGVLQGLLTPWGLLKHYWVLFKLGISVVAGLLLVLHLGPIDQAAAAAAEAGFGLSDVVRLRIQILADAGAALVALVIATVLSVYKPRGETRFGRSRSARPTQRTSA